MHPILFVIPSGVPLLGGVPVFAYGVMLGLSFVLGWYLTLHLSERAGLERRHVMGTMAVGIVGSLLGSRLLHFVANPADWHGLGSLLELDSGGLVAWGGYLGGLLSGAIWGAFVGGGFYLRLVDHAAPALALGLGLTRIGCFLYGCDFGQRTDAAWGVHFHRWSVEAVPWIGSPCEGPCPPLAQCSPLSHTCIAAGPPALGLHERLGYVAPGADASLAVHPVQLYESASGFLIFAGLLILHRYRRFTGQVMLGFLLSYSVVRFGLERLREDPERGFLFALTDGEAGLWRHLLAPQSVATGDHVEVVYGLSTSQAISAALVVASLGAGWWAWRRAREGARRTIS